MNSVSNSQYDKQDGSWLGVHEETQLFLFGHGLLTIPRIKEN